MTSSDAHAPTSEEQAEQIDPEGALSFTARIGGNMLLASQVPRMLASAPAAIPTVVSTVRSQSIATTTRAAALAGGIALAGGVATEAANSAVPGSGTLIEVVIDGTPQGRGTKKFKEAVKGLASPKKPPEVPTPGRQNPPPPRPERTSRRDGTSAKRKVGPGLTVMDEQVTSSIDKQGPGSIDIRRFRSMEQTPDNGVSFSELSEIDIAVGGFPEIKALISLKETHEYAHEAIRIGRQLIRKSNVKQGKFVGIEADFYDFVITADGKLVLGGGHAFLSEGAPYVKAAGSIDIDEAGRILEINSQSGHYKPTVEQMKTAESILSGMGLDLSYAKLIYDH